VASASHLMSLVYLSPQALKIFFEGAKWPYTTHQSILHTWILSQWDEVFQPRSRRVEPQTFSRRRRQYFDADVTGSRDLFRIIVATQRSPPERWQHSAVTLGCTTKNIFRLGWKLC